MALKGFEESAGEVEARNIWVFIETVGNAINLHSLEVLGKARELGDTLGTRVEALLFGKDVKQFGEELIQNGADLVYVADSPVLKEPDLEIYKRLLISLVKERSPEILLFSATHFSNALAALTAASLRTGLVTDCVQLDVDTSGRLLIQVKRVYQGRILASLTASQARPQIATVMPRSFPKPYPDSSKYGRVEDLNVEGLDQTSRTKILGSRRKVEGKRSLEGASIIVSGGRGVGSKKDFGLIEGLALALGGRVGASRSAVQMGIASKELHIGQTGRFVDPKVYIACGISGSIEHLMGVSEAARIVAVNNDPDAPVFKVAEFGVVADLHTILPLLIDEVKKIRSPYR